MTYINKNKIVGGDILAPYTNSGETWDLESTRGWQVRLVFSHTSDVIVDKESKEECIKLLESLGLIAL